MIIDWKVANSKLWNKVLFIIEHIQNTIIFMNQSLKLIITNSALS